MFIDIEAEQQILGTIIVNQEYLRKVEDILISDYFSEPFHQVIYSKFFDLKKDGISINAINLKTFFAAEKQSEYLPVLLRSTAELYCDIRDAAILLKEHYTKRKIHQLLSESIENLESSKVIDVCDNIINEIAKIDSDSRELEILTTEDMAKALENNWKLDLTSLSVPTGLPNLDKMLNGGLYPKKLYVVGAAPGVGKTSFSQQIIQNALQKNIGVMFFSMEMERETILARFLSAICRINPFRIQINKIYNHEINHFDNATKKWGDLSRGKFFMSDKSGVDVSKMKQAIKKMQRKNRIGLVVVDYIQIIPLRDAKINEATLIKENIDNLKAIAKEFNVAVLALSQLTKEDVVSKPTVKSLKGSGGINEGADTTALLWADGESSDNTTNKSLKLMIAKNRNGSLGEVSINYDGEFGVFTENNNF